MLLSDDVQARLARVAAAERDGIQQLPTDDPLDEKRRLRVEATRPELLAQPGAVENTLSHNADALAETVSRLVAKPLTRCVLVGAGDSLAVAVAARSALEAMLGVPCEPMQSLEFAKYGQHAGPGTLLIALSSSGETTRTVEAMLKAQASGCPTVSVTNTPTSTLAELSEHTLEVLATRVGWPTQSSTAALALLLRLAILTGLAHGADRADEWDSALALMPGLMTETLLATEPAITEMAAREHGARMYLFCGGGPNLASAIVGAAKVKECSPDHALAVQVEEYHHYNSQKTGEPLWLFAPSGLSVARVVDTAREARRFGGRVYVATSAGERAFDGLTDGTVELPATPEPLSPLLYFLPAQLFGYHVAMAKFAAAAAAVTP